MKIVFRVDASFEIGSGHVMRCITLAEALRQQGAECIFICRQHSGNLIPTIEQRGFKAFSLPLAEGATATIIPSSESKIDHELWLGVSQQQDARDCETILRSLRPDWLIVDHYSLDISWESALRPFYDRLMVIDDLADRKHLCDLLLDQNVGDGLYDTYRNIVNDCCVVLIGPRFAILRPEFIRSVQSLNRSRDRVLVTKIVLMFGGSDRDSDTLQVIKVIEEMQPVGIKVDVILGPLNCNIIDVRNYCESRPMFNVLVTPPNVADLLAAADLCIGSGGGATYERLFLRLPSILKPIAKNQISPMSYMASIGLIETYEVVSELKEKLRGALTAGAKIPPDCVSDGVPAVVSQLLTGSVTLGPPTMWDVRRTFKWLQDKELRDTFLIREKPERKTHIEYWRRLLNTDQDYVFSVRSGKVHIGNCGVKNVNAADRKAEIWLYLGRESFRRRGYGRKILCSLVRYCRETLALDGVYLHVRADNIVAYNLYRTFSFTVKADASEGFHSGYGKVLRMERAL